jgi:hypothetical protein
MRGAGYRGIWLGPSRSQVRFPLCTPSFGAYNFVSAICRWRKSSRALAAWTLVFRISVDFPKEILPWPIT